MAMGSKIVVLAVLALLTGCEDGLKRTTEYQRDDGSMAQAEEKLAADGTFSREGTDEQGQKVKESYSFFAKSWPDNAPPHAPAYPGATIDNVFEETSNGVVQAQVRYTTPDAAADVASWIEQQAYGSGLTSTVSRAEDADAGLYYVAGKDGANAIGARIERKGELTSVTLSYAMPDQ